MENDYLWDKSGEDEEIERLENALKGFRYQPVSAPILPVKVLQIEQKPKFSFFNFRFAAAGFACLVITFIGLGIFLQSSNDKIEGIADLSQPIVQPIKFENKTAPVFIEPIVKTPTISQSIVRKISHTKEFETPKVQKTVLRKSFAKIKPNKEIILTEEEKFAYNQLMLALSITSEKLKEVKDKANGLETSINPVITTK